MGKRMLKRLTALGLAVVLVLSGAVFALAESFPLVKITASEITLRSLPGETASEIGHVAANRAVLVTGEVGNFYAVSYDSQTGYVLKTQLGGMMADAPVQAVSSNPSYTSLSNGSKGDAVKDLQRALKELGYYKSSIDGKYGSGTQGAVKAFQKMNGLSQTGTADLATQTLLYQGNPKDADGLMISGQNQHVYETLSRGKKGEQVKALQRRLQELGYYTKSIDGDYGSGTVSAIKAFQKKAGLAQTGTADNDTQLILYSAAAPAAKATPVPVTPVPTPAVTPVPQTGYPYTTYTTSSVNLREKATVNSDRLATVSKGATVTVLSDSGDFVQVSYNGKTGYLMKQYVHIPVSQLPGNTLQQNTQAQKNYLTLQQGSTGSHVKALQEALQELGFYSGTADGSFGLGTVTALKTFQKKNNLRQDGVAAPEVQQLIFEQKPINSKGKKVNIKTLPLIENYPMQLNDRGEAVTLLQKKLSTLGYFTAELTNVYNSATQKAVKEFQKDHSLTVDGKAGEKTLRLLNLISVTPAPNAPNAAPQNTPLTESNVIIMQNGTRGQAVERLQNRLMELGYYKCDADGIYDANEITAVRAFQKRNGLKADGIAGLETQVKLYSQNALPAENANIVLPTPVPFVTPDVKITLRSGSNGEYVRLLQERLTVLGYYSAGVDGNYGSGTLRAVVTFQQFHGLSADGVAGRQTQEILYSNNAKTYAEAKPTPAPTPKPTATPKPGTGQTPNTNTLLKVGSRGTDVKKMQERLVNLGYLSAADGIYGTKTAQAVKAFQKKNALLSDGIAGEKTLKRLYSDAALSANGGAVSLPTQQPSSGSTSSGSSGFAAPKAGDVRYANWYTEIRSRAKLMPDVVIYDPDTGLHYNLHMFSFGKHADAEPPTKQDVEIMNQIIGEDDWGPKYVWVIFSDGRVYIGSTHSKGHTVDHDGDNGLTGHICLHFPRIMSEAEATGPYAVSHQKEILWGWELTQAMIK